MKRTTPAKTPKTPGKTEADPKPTIWTMKINLVFGLHATGPWEAVLEIHTSATLEELHFAIQDAVGFEADHMYMFFVARTVRTRDRTVLADEDDTVLDATLDELFPLPRGRKFFYWFDFGDDWKFSIARTRTAPGVAMKQRTYPRVVSTCGKRPVQYPPCD